jgi:hypothetical protein
MGSTTYEWNNKKDKSKLEQIYLDGMTADEVIALFNRAISKYGKDIYIDIETEYGYYDDVSHNYWLKRKNCKPEKT